MAETAACTTASPIRKNSSTSLFLINNNSPNATNNNNPPPIYTKQRKRKRLSQVVDKLTTQVGKPSSPLNNNFHRKNNNFEIKQEPLVNGIHHGEVAGVNRHMFNQERKAGKIVGAAADEISSEEVPVKKLSPNTVIKSTGVTEPAMPPTDVVSPTDNMPSTQRIKSEVFRFDSIDRERYHSAISEGEEDVFSPSSSSNRSSTDSPHVPSSSNSPSVNLSSLRIKENIFEDSSSECVRRSSRTTCHDEDGRYFHHHGSVHMRYAGCSCAHCTPLDISPIDRYFPGGIGGIPASPVSPLTPWTPGGTNVPISPSPIYSFEQYLHSKYLPDYYRRRSHSDSDIPMWFEGAALSIKTENIENNTQCSGSSSNRPSVPLQRHNRHVPHPLNLPANKGGSVESETSSPQDSPLDLSVRGSRGSSTSSAESLYGSRVFHPHARAPATPPMPAQPPSPASLHAHTVTTTTSFLPRSLVPVPVVRGDVASPTTKESVAHRYNLEVSPVVEEMPPGSDVAYVCPICGQMFSLHDRLAKHMASRHKSKQQSEQTTKAYLCDVCQRSFARSDMLTRHMRLHTGIKPYTCRVCGQVFSRSDHLSTHQRTHTGEKPYRCPQCPYAACRRDMITRHMRTHARYEATGATDRSVSSQCNTNLDEACGGDSPRGISSCPTPDPPPPLSPSQALSSLSVHSPTSCSPKPEPMDND